MTSIATPGAEVVSERRQQYKPRYSATFDLTWRAGPWTINYNIDWQDKTKRYADDVIRGDPDYVASRYLFAKEKWEHAVQMDVAVREKISIYAGVHNLFDAKPPLDVIDYAGVNYNPTFAQQGIIGRFFAIGISAKTGPF